MGLFVSTTGTNVTIKELGITIVHPATDYDLSSQFSAEEIRGAASLTSAIGSGTLTWRKVAAGPIQLAADYDADWMEVEELNQGSGLVGDRLVKFSDLSSSTVTIKGGRVSAGSFTGSPKKYSVVFNTPFVANTYSVNITGADARTWTIESRLATGFTINSNANQALTGEVYWQAQFDGEVG